MMPGFRDQVRHEIGDVYFLKAPDVGCLPKQTRASCRVRRRGTDPAPSRYRFFITMRRRDYARWHVDPSVQMTVLHELGHASMNAHLSRAIHRSHFLSEAGATIWGYIRFGHLAPKVKRRHAIVRFIEGLPYYTEQVGFGLNQAFALYYATLAGRVVGNAINGEVPFPAWILAPVLAVSGLFFFVAAREAHQHATARGLRSFRLKGIW